MGFIGASFNQTDIARKCKHRAGFLPQKTSVTSVPGDPSGHGLSPTRKNPGRAAAPSVAGRLQIAELLGLVQEPIPPNGHLRNARTLALAEIPRCNPNPRWEPAGLIQGGCFMLA